MYGKPLSAFAPMMSALFSGNFSDDCGNTPPPTVKRSTSSSRIVYELVFASKPYCTKPTCVSSVGIDKSLLQKPCQRNVIVCWLVPGK